MRKKQVSCGILSHRLFAFIRLVLLGVCLVTAITGCAINPVSGRREMAVISVEKERELGAEEARKVEASMGLVADPRSCPTCRRWGGGSPNSPPDKTSPTPFRSSTSRSRTPLPFPTGTSTSRAGCWPWRIPRTSWPASWVMKVVHVAARHTVRSANVAVATSPLRIVTGIAGLAAGIIAPRVGEGIAGWARWRPKPSWRRMAGVKSARRMMWVSILSPGPATIPRGCPSSSRRWSGTRCPQGRPAAPEFL